MKNQRLLVTGGAGFIGSHIVDEALQAGWEVGVLDNLSSGKRSNLPPNIPFFLGDVRNSNEVLQAVAIFQPNVISHHAAQISVSASLQSPLYDAEVNMLGGLNVLEAARIHGVDRLVFASSGGAIYGEVPVSRADETTIARPYSPYAASKLAFENYLEIYKQLYGLDYVILRYANVYGPRQDAHGEAGVIAIFFSNLLQGKPLQINAQLKIGDTGCIRDYIFVQDIAKANLAAAMGKTPSLFNLGTGIGTSTHNLAKMLANIVGVTPNFQFMPPRLGDIKRSVLDSKYHALLGRLTPLETGLHKLINWPQLQDSYLQPDNSLTASST